MRTDEGELAERRLVQAFFLDGTLAIFATGEVPLPCFEVRIERQMPSGDPPEFVLVRRQIPGIFPELVTPYTVSALFSVSACPRTLVVAHAAGRDTLPVTDIRSDSSIYSAVVAGGAPIPYVFPPSALREDAEDDSATGYSSDLDFKEALAEAVHALKPLEAGIAEYPRTIRVVEVGIEEGGVANFHHLYVRVRRQSSPAPRPTRQTRLGQDRGEAGSARRDHADPSE